MHYNYYKLFIILFSNIVVCIIRKGNSIILFLVKILSICCIATTK